MKHIDRLLRKAKKAVEAVFNYPLIVDSNEECETLRKKGHRGIIIIDDIEEEDDDFHSPGLQIHGYYETHNLDGTLKNR